MARIWADEQQWDLDDFDLVEMVTAAPGGILSQCWGKKAGRLLASESVTDMKTRVTRGVLEVETTNLDDFDLYVDGHPQGSLQTGSRAGTRTVTHEFEGSWYQAEVVGYVGDVRRQRRLLRPAGV